MITEPELKDVLVRQAESYEVPPHDLMRLRALALRRRRETKLRYGGMVAATLLAVGVAWGQLRAEHGDRQPVDIPSDVTTSPSCSPLGEAPPVPDSPWAGAAFVSDEPVPATGKSKAPGRSCTLVLRYWFHRFGPGPFISGMAWLYSDGRLIIDTATPKDWFVQWERRLTPEGVERLRTTVVSMLDESGRRSGGEFEAKIHYGDGAFYPKEPGALVRLLIDLSWLSDLDWVTESPTIYRAAWYLTCYDVGGSHGNDVAAGVRELPSGARDVLESRTWTTLTRDPVDGDGPLRCVVLSRADASVLVEALGGDITEGKANVFTSGLAGSARQFTVHALMPDGTSGAHGD